MIIHMRGEGKSRPWVSFSTDPTVAQRAGVIGWLPKISPASSTRY